VRAEADGTVGHVDRLVVGKRWRRVTASSVRALPHRCRPGMRR